jgi:hypothetical protein
LERGRFIWVSPVDGVVAISAVQLAYMLDGIDRRNPRHTWLDKSSPRVKVGYDSLTHLWLKNPRGYGDVR